MVQQGVVATALYAKHITAMCIEYIASDKHWTDIFSRLAVPVIGGLGVYIALRQWRTGEYRLKLDLFDKRFVIYEAIIDFIMSIRSGGMVLDERLSIFKEKTLPARFLFNDEVAAYISEIKDKAIDVKTYQEELDGALSDDKRSNIQRKSSETRKWLYKQIEEKELNNRLGSFLRLPSNKSWLRRITNYMVLFLCRIVKLKGARNG